MKIETIGIAALFLVILYTILTRIIWKKLISINPEYSRSEKSYSLLMICVLVGGAAYLLTLAAGEMAGTTSNDLLINTVVAAKYINAIAQISISIPATICFVIFSVQDYKKGSIEQEQKKEDSQ